MDSRLYEEIGKAVEKARKNGGDLTTQNLLYVVKIAQNIAKKTGVDENELVAVGAEAMKKLENKYDRNKNDNFVKACGTSVRGEMMNFVNRQSNLVHIPVNHQRGFRKGQEAKDETNITYQSIDYEDYDSLGECSNYAFSNEEYDVFMSGMACLDEVARKTIKIKLKMDEYENIKNNNFQMMADELEVPVVTAKRIYTEALEKLSRYCQREMQR